jgi:tRNA pseudouridine55 synthase
MDGALILDKPAGMTSHDIVQAVRRTLGQKRVGHLGTLDPIATGVLVLLIGRATRLARFYREREKTYQGIIRFGYATDTMDRTGSPLSEDTSPRLTEEELRRAFAGFVGLYNQRPPAFSAKKISGVPAYRLARKGLPVELKVVPVVIHSFQLLWVDGARAGFEATVSSGTYLRSLVNDLGECLECGAHLAELRRTSLAEFTIDNALRLDELQKRLERGDALLMPLQDLLSDLPRVELNEAEAIFAGHGRDLTLDEIVDRVRLMNLQGGLIGIAEKIAETIYHPVVVLVTEPSPAPGEPAAGAQSSPVSGPAGATLLKTMLVLCGGAY